MTTEFPNGISRRVCPPKLLVGEDTVTGTSGRAAGVTSDGRVMTADILTVDSIATTARAGVTGRLPTDVTFTIDAGMTATVHPLVGGVTVAFNTAAAAAVAAVGKAVTLTAKNAPALTDITAMNVLIAASPAVSALIGPLAGAGANTFDAALAIAATNLWTAGTIPASANMALGEDGYWWPVESDDSRMKVRTDGYNSAADATQTLTVVGDPPRINGPAMFISTTAAIANGTTQYILPCALYGRVGVQIVWSRAAGARTIHFHAYGKMDTGAWAGAGAIPGAYLIEGAADWHYTAASVAFGAAGAGDGAILAWFDNPHPWDSIAIEMTVENSDANNSTVTANYVLYGGTK